MVTATSYADELKKFAWDNEDAQLYVTASDPAAHAPVGNALPG